MQSGGLHVEHQKYFDHIDRKFINHLCVFLDIYHFRHQ